MNENYIKFNNLGILVESKLNEVSQGNHNVDYYYIAYDIYDYTNGYVTLAVTLPDGTNLPELATSFKDFEFNGRNYRGFVFKLPQELTAKEGNLTVTINLKSAENDTRLCSSRLNITIHKSNFAENPTITEIQYNDLLETIREDFLEINEKIESGQLKGEKGDKGDGATIIVGNVQTGEPNTDAKVENVGTSTNAIFNFIIPKGDKGEKGEAGSIKFLIVQSLPTENIDETAMYLVPSSSPQSQNTYDEYVYTNGNWESIGTANVKVDMTDYVKFTDYASANKGGVVRINGSYGLSHYHDGLYGITTPTEQDIDNRVRYRPLTPAYLDYAIKVGLTTNTTELTEEEKAKAKQWLGISENGGGSTGEGQQIYDLIIKTQEEFEAFYTSLDNGTCTANSVLLVGDGQLTPFMRNDGKGLKLPMTLFSFHGMNGAVILISDFQYSETNKACIWYEEPVWDVANSYSIKGIMLMENSNSTSFGFSNCFNLDRCLVLCNGGINNTCYHNCHFVSNCFALSEGETAYAFNECSYISNCMCNLYATNLNVNFKECSYISNCQTTGANKYENCSYVSATLEDVGGGSGGGLTAEQVQNMIDNSINSAIEGSY